MTLYMIKEPNQNFDPSKVIYLVHFKLGFRKFYFHFHTMETADCFIKMFRTTFVESISDDTVTGMQLELLTEGEYKRLFNKEEE